MTRTTALPEHRGVRSMVFSLVALAALLFGVFVMHAGSPAAAAPMTTAAHVAHEEPATVVPVLSEQPHTSWVDCGQDCGVMVMMCVLLLTVTILLLLAASPAVRSLVAVARQRGRRRFAETAIPARPPSLLVLSISRT